tara:strand:+ start:6676 stop:7338 length:663 start_codon:yes stop_codon:yes gene_type:complete
MADIIQIKRGTASQWTSTNPVLADGELGFETDTKKGKLGNGVDAWTVLAYSFTGVIADDFIDQLNGATGKTTPVDADKVAISDSGAGSVLKSLTWANIKATLKTYFDTLYGYLGVPQNSRSAAYTLVLADAGKHIFHPSADTTPRTFTIPSNASVAFPIGTAVTFVNQNGGGLITIAITTDTMRLAVSGATGSRQLTANGVATALKITSTEWIISGSNLT